MKIIQVINAMISNPDKITDVVKNDREYFFLYNNKYKWSVIKTKDEENYYLHYYPMDDMTIAELSTFAFWSNYPHLITYKTAELKTQEAIESFAELYKLVAGKIYNLDNIFDDIINSSN